MRWFWIDRFIEFESGHRAVARKNVSLGESHVSGYVPGQAVLAPCFVVEGMAQTGGVLVAEANQFRHRVVLAKISSARFAHQPQPGDSLDYTALLAQVQPDGAIVDATAQAGSKLVAEAKLVFAHLGEDVAARLFNPKELFELLNLWKLFEVGRSADGQRLQSADLALTDRPPTPTNQAASSAAR